MTFWSKAKELYLPHPKKTSENLNLGPPEYNSTRATPWVKSKVNFIARSFKTNNIH